MREKHSLEEKKIPLSPIFNASLLSAFNKEIFLSKSMNENYFMNKNVLLWRKKKCVCYGGKRHLAE
jgi:hypothetical protein